MRNIRIMWLYFVAISGLVFLSQCNGDDDPPIDNTPSDGVNVADGFYVNKKGVDTVVITPQLKSEVVEAADFGTQARTGFYANYVYLEAGDYVIAQVVSKKITRKFGGPSVVKTDSAEDCKSLSGGIHKYTLIEEFAVDTDFTDDDAGAFTVSNAGLYKVTYDNARKEIISYPIVKAYAIGASVGGWSQSGSQELALIGTAKADSVIFKGTEITMRPGEYKFRFNCRYKIDRRDEGATTFAESVGYVLLTNFGGASLDAPVAGGANFSIATGGDGKYTLEAKWTKAAGFALSATKTSSLDPVAFSPTEHNWGVIGKNLTKGTDNTGVWTQDIDLNYEGKTGNKHVWKIDAVQIPAPGTPANENGFKFRTGNSWDKKQIGFGNATLTGTKANLVSNGNADGSDGGNFTVTAAVTLSFVLSTENEGTSWTLEIK